MFRKKMFRFEKRDVTDYIHRQLETFKEMKGPLRYIIETLTTLGHCITITDLDNVDLSGVKDTEKEGKNYHWTVITYKHINLVMRRYGSHFTIFSKVGRTEDSERWETTQYGAFTFHSDFNNIIGDNPDEFYDTPCIDLQACIKDLITILVEGNTHALWNHYSFPRAKHVTVEIAFYDTTIVSVDKFIYCMEEIEQIHLELFAENDMVAALIKETERVGTMLDRRETITKIKTEVISNHHSVGIFTKDEKGKERWHDVYSLTRWHHDAIMGFKSR